MTDRLTLPDSLEPADVDLSVVPLLDGIPDGPFPPAQPQPRSDGVPGLYGNLARNGRMAAPLPADCWAIRWRSDLAHATDPHAVLVGADRALVTRRGVWELFNDDGVRLNFGSTWADLVTLDPVARRFFTTLPTGLQAAYDIATGERLFLTHSRASASYVRGFTAARANRLWTVSHEVVNDIHAERIATRSIFERIDLGEDLRADPSGFLASATAGPRLIHHDPQSATRVGDEDELSMRNQPLDAPRMLGAASGELLYAATFDRLYTLDLDLNIARTFGGSFAPVALSVDERGRMYLLVTTAGGPAYWTVDAKGVRVVNLALGSEFRDLVAPPIVAYNHVVYLVTAHAIISLGADGRQRWNLHSDDEVVGALLTADNQLLVTTVGAVYAIDGQGVTRGLFGVVGDEPFCTAAVITEHDTIVVATRSALLCYAPEVVGERTLTMEGFNWSGG